MVPQEDIEKLVNDLRADGYLMMRKLSVDTGTGVNGEFSLKNRLPGVEIQVVKVAGVDIQVVKVAENSSFDGKTLEDLELGKKYGVTVLSIRRNSEMVYVPDGNSLLLAKDTCVLLGKPQDLFNIRKFFEKIPE
ncbi:TrkA C-terminal domain-containing protein [Methanosarcina sp.]|uniref:cation:proton antiporter regulatory subunit n=1 Tax=Methanosarcina sp. TaxID=2213 RepID=UPI0029882BCE|nr:TrkA C-terminal domain-containing protein [Methanosarcina sp.]MDW5549173.1 TrkA C-terminal domain-containing protein [Methanosarcina sp.]MDW5553121.1 TrkA C-terminal domain-containing protein [Methanosarcina sp.]MDW5559353.1 TrkA C-terminal domain-containing protein [Methanosarcina sp.]